MREEEKKQSSQGSKIKRFMKKRWVYPSVYIASAAIILTAVLWFQNSNNSATDDQIDYEATDLSSKYDEPALEVNRSMENFAMPVMDPDSVVIQKEFYDFDASEDKQEAALVFYNNTYHPNTGIDITMENGESFDVVAALSGKVTNVAEDALLGNVIEIEHDKGIVTQYQSVTDIDVKVGDQVDQGQTLAKAGKSLYNEEAGTHLHFEIRKDGIAVNPLDYFNKPLSALQEADITENVDDSGKADESTGASEEEKANPDNDEKKDNNDSTEDEAEEDSNDSTEEDGASSDDEEAETTNSTDA
ncbi:peptidoglycan DD-metalloendopeptidase family protein [Robertmurraya sp. DFI.2.37]|uniref:M23 family metallopeptidase n=1 Tax=Robertmurraya sp. DFI.2.37 TaxID=3031819 RepID=UPI0012445680|nr:M23 family metallopeptidase [Robertmurraya sp. DFI.2.37]MDF1508184.1 peptidoglycan DD-metalloendopeptidase family protein [Robertmurraya sp. DFI.2.37]